MQGGSLPSQADGSSIGLRHVSLGGVALFEVMIQCATGFASALLIRQTQFEFRCDAIIRGRGE